MQNACSPGYTKVEFCSVSLDIFFNTEAKLHFAYTSLNMTNNATGKN